MKMDHNFEEVMKELKSKARPDNIEGMSRFGIKGDGRLGLSMPELRKMGKSIGKDHDLALKLWATKIPDAMILAALVDDPAKVTEKQVDSWVKDICSWDVCDQLCMNLLDRVPFASKKIYEWSKRDEEYVKRVPYALIACIAWHDKDAPDELLTGFFPVIESGATDERNYVKKAVSWALRHIGKRNLNLNKKALELAREIKKIDSKAARWIASDVIRELESEAVHKRLKNKK
ncbi:MAG: DNA alkylation repair protein [Actinobacteria bacterium]|nr:DNA alkylation repair protein [Actinomycetota bacterium]